VKLNEEVRSFWEQEPCGTSPHIVGEAPRLTADWFEKVEEHRYSVEPFIHSVAQFTRHHGKKVLEVGVGAGTDHLQWARAGAQCHGVDLTDAAIETTRARLAHYGFSSDLRRVDAETLPFPDATFDVVWSWGVIHHSERPEAIVEEIRRVLRPGGRFLGMMYGRRSILAAKIWMKQALLKGRPIRSLKDVLWHHLESVGTKAYTPGELRRMFGAFRSVRVQPLLTSYDVGEGVLAPVLRLSPDALGFFHAIRAEK
jgi:ubiquinone/menaquinone biosynthesis C-methylase UbiE